MSDSGAAYKLPFRPWERVLELGGGESPLRATREWVNLDSRFLPQVDLVADVNFPLPLPDEDFDVVFAKYVVEHVSWRRTARLLSEIHRVLRPGGRAVLFLPNTLEQCRSAISWMEAGDSLKTSETLFGSQEFGLFWDAGSHHAAFSPASIKAMLRAAGFFAVTVHPHPDTVTDMIVEAIKSAARIEVKA